jgi:hypothetical protein
MIPSLRLAEKMSKHVKFTDIGISRRPYEERSSIDVNEAEDKGDGEIFCSEVKHTLCHF